MADRITIYVSEPTRAILNELEGDSTSAKVAFALASLDKDATTIERTLQAQIAALRRQRDHRNNILKRIAKRYKTNKKINVVLGEEVLDITELL
jgi:hypothetical protein